MFGFNSKEKEIANRIIEMSMEGTYQIVTSLKEEPNIRANCIGESLVQSTTVLFLIGVYDVMLRMNHNEKQCFDIISKAVIWICEGGMSKDMALDTYYKQQKQLALIVNEFSSTENFEFSDALTTAFFTLVIENQEYLIKEIDNEISNSNCYKKIKEQVEEAFKNGAML